MGMCGQELGGVAKVCRFQPSGWQVLASSSAACVHKAEKEREGRVGAKSLSKQTGGWRVSELAPGWEAWWGQTETCATW